MVQCHLRAPIGGNLSSLDLEFSYCVASSRSFARVYCNMNEQKDASITMIISARSFPFAVFVFGGEQEGSA